MIVQSDGTAFWSRPGEINSMCQLEGLVDFPFDQIVCRMRFGGWSLGGSAQNLSFYSEQPMDLTLVRNSLASLCFFF